MNVNLNQFQASDPGETRSLMETLRRSAAVLAEHEDTAPVGPPVLVPTDQEQYPGAFRVWYPTQDGWVWVDDEGVVNHLDFLPTNDDMYMGW